MEQGPALIEAIAGRKVANRIPAMLWNGVQLDPVRKAGSLWAIGGSSSAMQEIAERWPGWTWTNLDDQVDMTALEAERHSAPERADAFRSLSECFDRHQLIDKGTESSALLLQTQDWLSGLCDTAGLSVTRLEDNAFAHHPIDLPPVELADTREAINAAELRCSPGC
ncbi:hypothetical protein HLB23_23555 [Nocardia uniformis]|uniref:Uncharacterized protein n=1 Tax=Nocardia uniformis TaxID=53432 RepID=A0A849CGY1_9NOCA|nr:hypothetical protein [Nocardia uniformis]NNH72801.1 hypothetical protein [Nocardia uniformis]